MNPNPSDHQEPVTASPSVPAMGPEAWQQLNQLVPDLAELVEKYIALQFERFQIKAQKNLQGFLWLVWLVLITSGVVVLGFGFLFLALAQSIAFNTGWPVMWGYLMSGLSILLIMPLVAKIYSKLKSHKTLLRRIKKHDTNL